MKVNISNTTETKERFLVKGFNISCENVVCFNKDKCEECIFYEKEYTLENLYLTGFIKDYEE